MGVYYGCLSGNVNEICKGLFPPCSPGNFLGSDETLLVKLNSMLEAHERYQPVGGGYHLGQYFIIITS